MSLLVTRPQASFVVEAGSHVAYCSGVIDIGIQRSDYQGETSERQQCVLMFDIPAQRRVFKKGEGESPARISNFYNVSTHPKSNLGIHLHGWLGALDDNMELATLAGKPCMLTVVHEKKGDRTFARISAISPLPEKMEAPAIEDDPIVYEIEDGTGGEYHRLPEWIQNFIGKSLNWGAM